MEGVGGDTGCEGWQEGEVELTIMPGGEMEGNMCKISHREWY